MGMAKVSITVDEEILRQAREIAPGGNLSKLVSDALLHQVRLERMRRWLEEEEAQFGRLPDDDPYHEHIRRQWLA